MNVRRWDNVVHVVRYVDIDDVRDRTALLECDRRIKLYVGSQNKLTEDAPTCFKCIVAELKDVQ